MKGKSLLVVIVLFFVAYSCALAGVAGVRDRVVHVYTTQPGDYFVHLTRDAGFADEEYLLWIQHNSEYYFSTALYHETHNHLPIGMNLVVPSEMVGGFLGGKIVSLAAEQHPGGGLLRTITVTRGITASEMAKNGQAAVGSLLAAFLIAVFLVALCFIKPWNILRPATGGPAIVPDGVNTPTEAIAAVKDHVVREMQHDLEDIPRPINITRLWEIRFRRGTHLLVRYADGRESHTLDVTGTMAWLAEITGGRRIILLQRCGNGVRSGRGYNLLEGDYKIIREIDLAGVITETSQLEILPVIDPVAVQEDSPMEDSPIVSEIPKVEATSPVRRECRFRIRPGTQIIIIFRGHKAVRVTKGSLTILASPTSGTIEIIG